MAQHLRLLVFGFCMLAVSAQAGNTSAQENSGNPLHEAAERGDKAKVEALLDSGADINAKDER
jgi:ankyrin repeat protein